MGKVSGTPEEAELLAARVQVELDCKDESLTKQCFAVECDVNRIMKRAMMGAVLPGAGAEGVYLDVSKVGDFREAQERVVRGRRLFEGLAEEVRRKFGSAEALFEAAAVDPVGVAKLLGRGAKVAAEEEGGVGDRADSDSDGSERRDSGAGRSLDGGKGAGESSERRVADQVAPGAKGEEKARPEAR